MSFRWTDTFATNLYHTQTDPFESRMRSCEGRSGLSRCTSSEPRSINLETGPLQASSNWSTGPPTFPHERRVPDEPTSSYRTAGLLRPGDHRVQPNRGGRIREMVVVANSASGSTGAAVRPRFARSSWSEIQTTSGTDRSDRRRCSSLLLVPLSATVRLEAPLRVDRPLRLSWTARLNPTSSYVGSHMRR